MKISTKEQYATKAMIYLAINNKKPVTLTELSGSLTISISYLEQLFSILRHSGLVQGVRGPGGGYRLGKASDQISIVDIILAIEQSAANTNSKRHLNGKEHESSLASGLWNGFSEKMSAYLDSISLADIIKDQVEIKNQNRLNETTRHISSMFPVSAKLKAA